MFASLNLGIGLIIAGLVFVILVWGVLSLVPRVHASRDGAVPFAPRRILKQSMPSL